MNAAPSRAGRRRAGAHISPFVAALAALQLPESVVPTVWALALVALSAGVSGMIQRLRGEGTRRLSAVAPWAALAFGPLAAALAVAPGAFGPVGALAGILLLALGFHAQRDSSGDIGLVVFLGLCLVLVGAILEVKVGGGTAWLSGSRALVLVPTLGAMLLALLADAMRPLADAGMPEPRLPRAVPVVWYGLVATFAATVGAESAWATVQQLTDDAVVERTERSARDGDGRRVRRADRSQGPRPRAGLDTEFELSGSGAPLDLQQDTICIVESLDRTPVGGGLLLRYETFEIAEETGWRTDAPRSRRTLERLRRFRSHVVGDPDAWNGPIRRGRVQILGELEGRILAPSSCWRIESPVDLVFDVADEELRPAPGTSTDGISYVVDWVADGDPLVGARSVAVDARAPPTDTRLERSLMAHRGFLERRLRELVGPDARERARRDLGGFLDRLRSALQEACTYRLSAPSGRHGIELLDFLDPTSDPAGYCMHFAHAGATLLRLAGVPCRIAVGLASGEADPSDPLRRRFGSRHAHAWVEVSVEDRGWLPWDPSPPGATAVGGNGRGWPEDGAGGGDAGIGEAGPWLPALGPLGHRSALLVLTASLAVGSLLVSSLGALRRWRLELRAGRLPVGATRHAAPRPEGTEAAVRDLDLLLTALSRRGIHRTPGTSLEATVRRAPHTLRGPLERAVAAYQEVRFGGRVYDAERAALLREAVRSTEPPTTPES